MRLSGKLICVWLASMVVACSSPPVRQDYDYFAGLSVAELAAEVEVIQSDGVVTLRAPQMVDPLNWQGLALLQYQQLTAEYHVAEHRLSFFWRQRFSYSVKAQDDQGVTLPSYDRARVNAGDLQVLDKPSEVTKACGKEFCEYASEVSLPISVATVRDNRYKGLHAELISLNEEPMAFGLPESYLRAFSERAGEILAGHFMDYKRVNDAHAGLQLNAGRDQLQVELLANEWQCDRASVKPVAVEATKTLFQVECAGNRYRLVRCQWGSCAPLADSPE